MTHDLDNACTQIMTVLSTITGIDSFQYNPPEIINQDKTLLIYPEDGEKDAAPVGTKRGLHNIAIYFLKTRQDLGQDIALLRPFIDVVPDKLTNEVGVDPTTGATGGQFLNSIETFEKVTYKFEFLEYAGVQFVAYHFTMQNVKIIQAGA